MKAGIRGESNPLLQGNRDMLSSDEKLGQVTERDFARNSMHSEPRGTNGFRNLESLRAIVRRFDQPYGNLKTLSSAVRKACARFKSERPWQHTESIHERECEPYKLKILVTGAPVTGLPNVEAF